MDELQRDADLCVKCGLCLPYCPTYRLAGNENESPRGRISLIQAYAGGQLEATQKLIGHIDHCLLCRSCEKVCPAEVPYGRLIDRFRSLTHKRHPYALATKLIKKISTNRRYRVWAQKGLHFYRNGALGFAARNFRLLRLLGVGSMERLLPDKGGASESMLDYYPSQGAARGNVGLFTGCLGELLDQATLDAAVHCLTSAGYNVHVPSSQTCCGALAQHDGDADAAGLLAEVNGRAFANPQLDAIVTVASGCGAHLKEYENSAISEKIIDISQFLSRCDDFLGLLKPHAETVCLHTPCSLKNVMREEVGALSLLRRIPELRIVELPSSIGCCGAAGSYVLKHPKIANALLDKILEAAIATKADYLATSNIGCALHIAAGLREKKSRMQVAHPLILIAQQLQKSEISSSV